VRALVTDGLVVVGLLIMTIGVYGAVRLPDVYTQLHATSKAAFLGVAALLVSASVQGGDGAIIARSVLIIALLAVTTPVAAHAIGRASRRRGERMLTPGAVDETAERTPQPGP
jgi:multicomponent Na+:H+ antiporter subunit G